MPLPSVGLSNCSDVFGAGQVLQEEHHPSEDDVLYDEVFPLFLLCLLPGSCVWHNLLLALGEFIHPQAAGISDRCPVPTGQASFPAGKVIFSSYLISCVLAAFHCTFAKHALPFCLINNNAKPLRNIKLFICTWCNVLVSPELRHRPRVPDGLPETVLRK